MRSTRRHSSSATVSRSQANAAGWHSLSSFSKSSLGVMVRISHPILIWISSRRPGSSGYSIGSTAPLGNLLSEERQTRTEQGVANKNIERTAFAWDTLAKPFSRHGGATKWRVMLSPQPDTLSLLGSAIGSDKWLKNTFLKITRDCLYQCLLPKVQVCNSTSQPSLNLPAAGEFAGVYQQVGKYLTQRTGSARE